MKKFTNLKRTCFACPEQWEGTTEDGDDVYARERHGYVRVDINGNTVFNAEEGTALDALYSLFEIPIEVIENS